MPTILLIDDDHDFVEATCTVLESASYEVLVAYNGDEGLTRAREARPDLIILDVIMPLEDGFQTFEKLQADPALAHVPVMMLTGLSNSVGVYTYSLDLAPVDGVHTAVKDYIEKPIKPAELLQRVEELLGLRNTQHST